MDSVPTKTRVNKGAWTPEEDRKLAEAIAANGPKRWKIIASKAGLNRCGKSCRLRWMNYLRPNIKRGNISDQEEDLILRLHKLLGNRWSLIAGRLPGRTDNEIKNYWNSHLRKRMNRTEKQSTGFSVGQKSNVPRPPEEVLKEVNIAETSNADGAEHSNVSFDVDDLFDFSSQSCSIFDWVTEVISDDRRFHEFSSGFVDQDVR